MKKYYSINIAGLFLLVVHIAQAGSGISKRQKTLPVLNNSTIHDTITNPKLIESYANILVTMNSDPSLRSDLSPTQNKTLSYYDSLYKKNLSFKSEVNKALRGIKPPAQKKEGMGTETKESKEASRDRKKAGLDNLQKLLDIIKSMNPKI